MFEKEEQVTIWLRFGWDLPEEVDSHGALISAFRYGTLYSNTESMEVQIYGSHCCFLRLYEVWYRSLEHSLVVTCRDQHYVFAEPMFNQPNAQIQRHRLSYPLVKTLIL